MIKAIYMPKLNSKSDQYFFGNCSKNSGDDVKKGRILLEVETDKVVR